MVKKFTTVMEPKGSTRFLQKPHIAPHCELFQSNPPFDSDSWSLSMLYYHICLDFPSDLFCWKFDVHEVSEEFNHHFSWGQVCMLCRMQHIKVFKYEYWLFAKYVHWFMRFIVKVRSVLLKTEYKNIKYWALSPSFVHISHVGIHLWKQSLQFCIFHTSKSVFPAQFLANAKN